jgi:hypothetical protein
MSPSRVDRGLFYPGRFLEVHTFMYSAVRFAQMFGGMRFKLWSGGISQNYKVERRYGLTVRGKLAGEHDLERSMGLPDPICLRKEINMFIVL